MEEYLKVVFLAAPGFIAQRAASFFGNNKCDEKVFDGVMTYVVYSLVCIPLSFLIISLFNIYPNIGIDTRYSQVLLLDPTLRQIIYAALSIVIVSFSFGAIWQLFIKKRLKKAIEFISLKYQAFIPVTDDIFLEDYFKNLKKPALIAIKKDDRRIMMGAYLGSSFSDIMPVINIDERYEQISLWEKSGNEFTVNDRLYIPQYDLTVEVYKTPDHFFEDESDLGGGAGLGG